MSLGIERIQSWLPRILGTEGERAQYKELRGGPVQPVIDIFRTGPVEIFASSSTSSTDRTLNWTNLTDGSVIEERLPAGYFYRFYHFFISSAADATVWRARLNFQGPTALLPFEFVRTAGTPNAKSTLVVQGGTANQPTASLVELARHWYPGPLEVEVDLVSGALVACQVEAWLMRYPHGAECPP